MGLYGLGCATNNIKEILVSHNVWLYNTRPQPTLTPGYKVKMLRGLILIKF